jgi:protein-S-isoprenylcysteine O-methyltransferase Ste14
VAFLDVIPITALNLALWVHLHRFHANRGARMKWRPRGLHPWTTRVLVLMSVGMVAICFTGAFGRCHPLLLPVVIAGNLLAATGFVLIRRGRDQLGEHYSIWLEAPEGHELVTEGLFARVRHPMYAGSLLHQAALPLLTCTWEGLILLPFYFGLLLLRMRGEESVMAERHGKRYSEWTERTRRLIPRVY